MKATNIIWDIDFDDEVNLPNEIRIPEGMIDEDEISDYLSNITGYCHKGFLFDRVKIYRDCGEKDGNIMKLIYHVKEHGNTAIIEEVYTLPYREAAHRQKGYKVTYMADYDNYFVYRISVFETLEDAKADLKRCAFDI